MRDFFEKEVKLVDGGSVINGTTPSSSLGSEKKSVSEKTGEISVAKNTSSTWPLELSVVECAFLPHNTKLSGENL